MPPDDKPPMPPQPPTVSLPKMTDRAMLEDLYRISKTTAEQVVEARRDIADVSQNVSVLEARVVILEDRTTRHSGGARQLSDTDAKHEKSFSEVFTRLDTQDAAIGDVKTAVVTVQAAVAENTFFTKKAITGFAKEHPQLVQAAIGLLMAALGFATSWFSSHGGH